MCPLDHALISIFPGTQVSTLRTPSADARNYKLQPIVKGSVLIVKGSVLKAGVCESAVVQECLE